MPSPTWPVCQLHGLRLCPCDHAQGHAPGSSAKPTASVCKDGQDKAIDEHWKDLPSHNHPVSPASAGHSTPNPVYNAYGSDAQISNVNGLPLRLRQPPHGPLSWSDAGSQSLSCQQQQQQQQQQRQWTGSLQAHTAGVALDTQQQGHAERDWEPADLTSDSSDMADKIKASVLQPDGLHAARQANPPHCILDVHAVLGSVAGGSHTASARRSMMMQQQATRFKRHAAFKCSMTSPSSGCEVRHLLFPAYTGCAMFRCLHLAVFWSQ